MKNNASRSYIEKPYITLHPYTGSRTKRRPQRLEPVERIDVDDVLGLQLDDIPDDDTAGPEGSTDHA